MKRTKKQEVETMDAGGVSVREIKWHPKCSHRVLYVGADGKRKSKYFTTETDAIDFAERQRKELGINGKSFGTITDEERAALKCWRGFIEGKESPPDLLTVIRDYVRTWQEKNESVTLAEALDKYVAHQESEGASKRHIDAIKSRVGRLVVDHPAMLVSSLDSGTFTDWLNGLRGNRADVAGEKLSATTRDNLKRTIRTFYGYCIAREWTSKNPVEKPSKKRTKEHRVATKKAPAIMLPADVEKFLHKVEEVASPILPFWLLKFFGGIRDAEAGRLDWSMIDMKKSEISVPADASKTGDARTVTILPTLADWIAPYVKTSGPLAPAEAKRRYYYKKVLRHLRMPDKVDGKQKRGAPKKPFNFPSNAARHSFGTYHLYYFRNAGETSIQLGHKGDPTMLHEHYKNQTAEKHAADFWKIKSAIKKPKGKKIVNIQEGRGAA